MFFFTTYYFINETKRIIYLNITCNFLYKRIENKSRIKFLRELLLENYSKLFIDKLNILISFLINLMLYQSKQIKSSDFLLPHIIGVIERIIWLVQDSKLSNPVTFMNINQFARYRETRELRSSSTHKTY